ncbi:MAG: LysM peptidoglycan-binding domain-containing protein [candidate division KSB1 bacterium]|nr:LysM peptidoglycan-binding domain-containing protein [candidate division KSB1 bacterium]
MRVSSKILLTLVLSFVLVFGATLSIAQEEMTMEEYEAQLAEWQQREADARAAKEECEAAVEALNEEVQTVESQTQEVWNEILSEIGTDVAGVDEFRGQLESLDEQADGLLALSAEELFEKRDEMTALEEQLAAAKENRIAALSEMQDLIATIEGKLAQINNKMPKAVYDDYNVVVGDYLWKISGKEAIYDDPTQWMRIYSVNTDQIDDPDLIFPEQVLKIQRGLGMDQYLIAKGDYLQKIAENPEVLGDPSNWTKIYEKNKEIIGDDPNMVFPHTVLVIPQE